MYRVWEVGSSRLSGRGRGVGHEEMGKSGRGNLPEAVEDWCQIISTSSPPNRG